MALFSVPAIPVVGDLLRHTVAPLIGEAMAPKLIERMSRPNGYRRALRTSSRWLLQCGPPKFALFRRILRT